ARLFNLWETKALMRAAFGDVPLEWKCARTSPGFMKGIGGFLSEPAVSSSCPFGTFLGLSATMRHWVRTAKNPLEVGLEKAKGSVVTGVSMKPVHRQNGVRGDERSLSV
ncbi:MAG: hypothetical protein JW821_06960, partial [Deltaproteobacteria bacterium]|nr:hypothetical protein [Deltaproteobacteria bacterium]